MIEEDNPENESLRNALWDLSVKNLWDALENGADVNTSIEFEHPLHYILERLSSLPAFDLHPDMHAKTQEFFVRMAKMLINLSPDLLNVNSDVNIDFGKRVPMSSLDCILCGAVTIDKPEKRIYMNDPVWVDLAARCVIATLEINLHRKTAPYTINFNPIKESLTGSQRATATDAIFAVHERVRERLESPEANNKKEMTVAAAKIPFWTTPLSKADIAAKLEPLDVMAVTQEVVDGVCDDFNTKAEPVSQEEITRAINLFLKNQQKKRL